MESKHYARDLAIFKKKWHEISPSTYPKNRFQCASLLEDAIKAKKGAYTESERLNWLYAVLVCMYAPDSYFSGYPIESSHDVGCTKKLDSEIKYFFSYYSSERDYNNGLYPYIDCAKSTLLLSKKDKNLPSGTSSFQTALINKFKSEIGQLTRNIGKTETQLEKEYGEFYANIQTAKVWFSEPVLFVFLPYFLFWEFAKQEGLLQKDAYAKFTPNDEKRDYENSLFSFVQLSQESLCWSARSCPFKIENESDFDKLIECYQFVERVIYKTAAEINPYSIGQASCQAWFNSARRDRDSDLKKQEEHTKAFIKDPMCADKVWRSDKQVQTKLLDSWGDPTNLERGYACFCVPILHYGIWADRVYGLLDPNAITKDELKKNLKHIFSLLLRQASPQIQNALSPEDIPVYHKDDLKIILEKRGAKATVSFFDFLVAIGKIYSPAYFFKDTPFDNPELQQAIEIIIEAMYPDKINLALEDQWRFILQDNNCSSLRNFMINPNCSIVDSILLRGFISALGKNDQLLSSHAMIEGPNSASILPEFIRSLNACIGSESTVVSDIEYWTGIHIVKQNGAITDLFAKWNTAYPLDRQQEKLFDSLCSKIAKKPKLVYPILDQIPALAIENVKIQLPSATILSAQLLFNTPDIMFQKKTILTAIYEECGIALDVQSVDDIRYIELLYHLFLTARNEMYSTIYKLCLKFLPLLGGGELLPRGEFPKYLFIESSTL